MLKNNKSYINNKKTKQAVSAEFKSRRFIAATLLSISFGVMSLQAGYVLNASAQGNPITSPISYSESPSPSSSATPITAPEVTPSPSASSSSNPITAPEVSPSPVASPSGNPVTAPEVSPTPSATPTPSASPSIAPSVEPSASPSPVASVEPSATPTPSATPEVSPSPSIEPSVVPVASNNPSSSNPSSNNSGGGNSNSGGSSAPSCNNEAPKAPYIVSAVTSGKNEITLNWTKPAGNVTHYSVAYGVIKNKPLYGASNIGNVTSFKVKGLSGGGTYFFIVKAVNDCTPSVASNEVGVKVGGQFISTPAQGFKAGVLGKNTKVVNQSVKPAASQQPIPGSPIFEVKPNTGLVGKVVSFFKGIFN